MLMSVFEVPKHYGDEDVLVERQTDVDVGRQKRTVGGVEEQKEIRSCHGSAGTSSKLRLTSKSL